MNKANLEEKNSIYITKKRKKEKVSIKIQGHKKAYFLLLRPLWPILRAIFVSELQFDLRNRPT